MALTYSQQVANQQAALNAANFGKTENYVPLKVDGILGNKTQAAFNQYGTPSITTQVTPATSAIPVDVLNTANKGIVTPPPTIPTAAAGLMGINDASLAQFKSQVNPTAQGVANQENTLANMMASFGDTAAIKQKAYQDAGVDEKQKNLTDAINKLEATQLGNRRQVEALLGNGAATLEQLSPQVQGLNRRAAAQEADLAILQNAASRNYETATAIADRAVEAIMEPAKARLEAAKFLYENNKDRFTKADEQRLKREMLRFNQQLEIETAKAKEKIAAGAVGVDNKVLATTQFKAAQSAQNLKNTLQKTLDAVKTYGNYESADARGKGILDTLKIQLRSEISTALEQGVVQPGEAASFDKIAGQLNKNVFIRNEKTFGSLNSLLESMNSRINTQAAALEGGFGVTRDQLDTILGVKPLPGKFDSSDPLGLGLLGNNDPLGLFK